jgi:hypothetical protein
MIELEIEILKLFASDKGNIKQVIKLIRENKNHLNMVGICGPFFNLLLNTRVFMTVGVVIEMIMNGFDIGHENNAGVVHSALLKSISISYSNELYDILQLLCSSAYFIETMPIDSILQIIFNSNFTPDLNVIHLLLHNDKGKKIKREMIRNHLFCQDIMKKYSVMYDLIIKC